MSLSPSSNTPLLLTSSLKTLSRLQTQLEGEIRNTARASGILSTAFKRNQKNASALGSAFSTMRSQMLLFSFAISMGGRQLVSFADKASKVQNMKNSKYLSFFNDLM